MTVQGPVKEQQPDGMSHRGVWGGAAPPPPHKSYSPTPDKAPKPDTDREEPLQRLGGGEVQRPPPKGEGGGGAFKVMMLGMFVWGRPGGSRPEKGGRGVGKRACSLPPPPPPGVAMGPGPSSYGATPPPPLSPQGASG